MAGLFLHDLLADGAARTPHAIALVESDRTPRPVTYGDLDALANRFAHVFRDAGMAAGDRVVIALENSAQQVAAYFGAMKAGGVAVPLPAGPRSDRLAPAVRDCTPRVCLLDPATLRGIGANSPVADVPVVFSLGSWPAGLVPAVAATPLEPQLAAAPASALWPVSPSSASSPDTGSGDTLAAIIYTSGSTGAPRGVMLTHANFLANARDIVSYLELTARDRAMCVLPFYYVYGLSVLHSHLLAGGTVVIDNRFTFPNVVLEAMQAHEVTGFAGVPSTFALLLHRSNLEATALPALRYVTQAGGHLPPTKVREWLARGPRAAFFVMYGATEAAARLTYVPPARLAEKLGSIGVPLPSVSIAIVREDGSLAGAGESGELVASGPNIARGYWNDAAETAERFGPLGYRTGDLGYVDADGFLFLVGRKHDMIKVGAHRVGAKEIEDVLTEAPLVAEAAVVAAPHDLQGEVPIAFVTLKGEAIPGRAVAGAAGSAVSRERGADANGHEHERALQAYCAARLAPHKVPPRIIIETELPKLAGTGKIDKPTLRGRARSLT